MFPNGWPGRGLLLLRFSTAIGVIDPAVAQVRNSQHPALTALAVSVSVSGVLLLVGLWTPIAGVLLAALQVATLFPGTDRPEIVLLCAASALSIAMLGPGVWSVDAVLFGRQRLEFPQD